MKRECKIVGNCFDLIACINIRLLLMHQFLRLVFVGRICLDFLLLVVVVVVT